MSLGGEVAAGASAPRLDLRSRWLLLATSALVIYCIVPVRRGAGFDLNEVSTWLEALMFVLSFPAGSAFTLAADALTGNCADCSIAQLFLLRAVALTLGYLQWFHLAPAIFGGGDKAARVVALNLSSPHTVGGQTAQAARDLYDAGAADAHDAGQPVRPFDERGRTPVERVLEEER
jgi:hypothetical protein